MYRVPAGGRQWVKSNSVANQVVREHFRTWKIPSWKHERVGRYSAWCELLHWATISRQPPHEWLDDPSSLVRRSSGSDSRLGTICWWTGWRSSPRFRTSRVGSVMTSWNSIWIQHWHELEHEMIPQRHRSRIIWHQEKSENQIQIIWKEEDEQDILVAGKHSKHQCLWVPPRS